MESASYIGQLDPTKPVGDVDMAAEGDDNFRLIKQVIQRSFAGYTAGPVLVTGTEAQGASPNNYVLTTTPALTTYVAKTVVCFFATHTCSGPCVLAYSGYVGRDLTRFDGTALELGDIQNGDLVVAVYNGTEFRLITAVSCVNRHGDVYDGTHNFANADLTVKTKANGDNSAAPASTAYVANAISVLAPLDSPEFVNNPRAPTQPPGTNDNTLATMEALLRQAYLSTLPPMGGPTEGMKLTNYADVPIWTPSVDDFVYQAIGVV